jgi:hypothetical protein
MSPEEWGSLTSEETLICIKETDFGDCFHVGGHYKIVDLSPDNAPSLVVQCECGKRDSTNLGIGLFDLGENEMNSFICSSTNGPW